MLFSTNPYSGEVLKKYELHSTFEIDTIISNAQLAFEKFKLTTFAKRASLFKNCADNLRIQKLDLAKIITSEMGKPIAESIAEIEKCAQVCEYYAENAEDFLSDETIDSDASDSFISYEPLGVLLAIMPWNFPFWQVFRFAAPSIMAGNVAILKHASNVPQSAEAIEKIFLESGFAPHVFSVVYCKSDEIECLIKNQNIKAVTITGSEKAGASVAKFAGENIKKSVLELGGNDAFIVLEDANLDQATDVAIKSRLSNAGQSCIAAKRFIVVESVLTKFLELLSSKIIDFKSANPLDPKTKLGTLARPDLAKDVHKQVSQCLSEGATLLFGSNEYVEGSSVYEPVILGNISSNILSYNEEIFGPVFSIISVSGIEEAISISNDSKYGLGGSVWTEDSKAGIEIAKKIETGAVFINGLVKSDPRLPFGGVKNSGYGRELSLLGIMEFVNAKTIWVA